MPYVPTAARKTACFIKYNGPSPQPKAVIPLCWRWAAAAGCPYRREHKHAGGVAPSPAHSRRYRYDNGRWVVVDSAA